MRVFVAGLSKTVAAEDVRARLASLGGTVHVEEPAERRLGSETLHRGFVHVSINEVEDDAVKQLIGALNGTLWKGSKLRVEAARPDFRARIHLEASEEETAHSKQSQATAASTDSSVVESSADDTRLSSLRIRKHAHEAVTVPYGCATGTQRKLFMPVAPMPLHQWVLKPPNAGKQQRRSAVHRLNDLWDSTLQRRLEADVPDASVFDRIPAVAPPQDASMAVVQTQRQYPEMEEDEDSNAGEVLFEDDADAEATPHHRSSAAAAPATKRSRLAEGLRAAYDSDTDSAASRGAGDRLLVARPPASTMRCTEAGNARSGGQNGAGSLPGGEDDDGVPLDALAGGVDVLGAGVTTADAPSAAGVDGPSASHVQRAQPASERAGGARVSAWEVLERGMAQLRQHTPAAGAAKAARRSNSHQRSSSSDAELTDSAPSQSQRSTEASDSSGEALSGSGSEGDRVAHSPDSPDVALHDGPTSSSDERALSRESSSTEGDSRDVEPAAPAEASDWDRLLALAAGQDVDVAGAEALANDAASNGDENGSHDEEEVDGERAPDNKGPHGVQDAPTDAVNAVQTQHLQGEGQPERTRQKRAAEELASGDDHAEDSGLQAGLQELQEELLAERAAASRQRKASKKRKRKHVPEAEPGDGVADEAAVEAAVPAAAEEQLAGADASRASDGQIRSLFESETSDPPAATVAASAPAPTQPAYSSAVTAALFADAPFVQPPARAAASHEAATAGNATDALALDDSPPARPRLETADNYAAFFAPVFGEHATGEARFPASGFVRQEPMEVLEAKLKAARPALLADFRSKQRTVSKKARALARERK